jgi:hypothetical protein
VTLAGEFGFECRPVRVRYSNKRAYGFRSLRLRRRQFAVLRGSALLEFADWSIKEL